MKNRKPRSDSTTAAIHAIESARKPPLTPPAHMNLRDGDRPYWDAIIAGRARDEWTPVTLVLAVQLARTQADIEIEGAMLAAEGSIVEARANARAQVVDVLVKRSMALMRTLRMGGQALGKTPTIENARRLESNARRTVGDSLFAGEDDLIAR